MNLIRIFSKSKKIGEIPAPPSIDAGYYLCVRGRYFKYTPYGNTWGFHATNDKPVIYDDSLSLKDEQIQEVASEIDNCTSGAVDGAVCEPIAS